jgi:hypothetical protein
VLTALPFEDKVFRAPMIEPQVHSPQLKKAPGNSIAGTSSNEAMVSKKYILHKIFIASFVVLLTFLSAEGVARLLVSLAIPAQSHGKDFDAKYYLAKRKLDEKKPILSIVGNSLSDWGIYSEFLASEIKNKGYDIQVQNFSAEGNTTEQNIFLLKTSIKAGSRPNLVLYSLHPAHFSKAFLKAESKPVESTLLFEKSYIGGCLYPEKSSWQQKFRCFFKKSSYLYRYRGFLKNELAALPDILRSPEKRLKLDFRDRPTVEVSPGGWRPVYTVFTEREFAQKYKQPPEHLRLEYFDHIQWTDETLIKMAAFCKREKIPLVAIWLPQHPSVKQYYAKHHISQEYFLVRFKSLSESLGIRFMDFHQAFPDSDKFYSPDHLNTLGAISFTQQLADRLAEDAVFKKALQAEVQR